MQNQNPISDFFLSLEEKKEQQKQPDSRYITNLRKAFSSTNITPFDSDNMGENIKKVGCDE